MRFRLLSDHYLPGDKLVVKDEEIGDGTRYPVDFKFYPPTHEMEGLDAESIAAVADATERFMRQDPVENIPRTLDDKR